MLKKQNSKSFIKVTKTKDNTPKEEQLKPKKRITKKKLAKMDLYKTLELECNTYKEEWSGWRKHLYEHGWAIVPKVVTAECAEQYRQRFWDWLEGFNTGLKRNVPSTHKSENWPGNIHGIFQNYGFGHNQFVWDIRCEPAIINVFKEIYGTDQLLVSFDGGNMSRPTNIESKPWPHFDQAHDKFGFHCIQGFLNLEQCGDHDGGLIVYQDSHKQHQPYFEETGEVSTNDWYKFDVDPNTLKHFKQCKKIKVNCQPGDVVLWDSRTIHYACPPQKHKSDVNRTVVYVSYQPAYLALPSDIASKQNAFYNNRMTSHWAASVRLFPKTPRTYGNEDLVLKFPISEVNNAVLTDVGRKLAGLIPYEETIEEDQDE
ncbi:hypothetical protein DLAC_00175 [Tieghemostelium lacteum]|uniref:Phytanoyl-CoA dioxygenase n=1 Tax=Tieghemostelium lacteum TaxID=361077 RepID=A0A152A910_TIELA|nr:hypothetical protein DLAC_00175 [Tieghemostelium lacteum]|eukprot:KYR02712.1 hypothetical protein DLAC_00175 [Tieghemostelium lacteum]